MPSGWAGRDRGLQNLRRGIIALVFRAKVTGGSLTVTNEVTGVPLG